ncbi:Chemotaxis protein CheD [gamma proteobacterium HdN1]|nr:Chemotaxis protein CheD [gamma proteobacterium HdN1]
MAKGSGKQEFLDKRAAQLPPTLLGFSHIQRYWDARHQMAVAKIMPGQLYVTRHREMIVTVLGSCVSACVRDKVTGVGGMNHFMLPIQQEAARSSTPISDAARYGNWAMEMLINEILKQGGKRQTLEVKLFGGGKVLSGINHIDVGAKNIAFVTEYIGREGFAIADKDMGGTYARKILYFPATGAVEVLRISEQRNDQLVMREDDYGKRIDLQTQNDVELFNLPPRSPKKS